MTGLEFSILFFVLSLAAFAFVITVLFVGKVTESQRAIEERKNTIIDRKKEVKKDSKKKKQKSAAGTYEIRKGAWQELSDKLLDQLLAADIMMRTEEFAMLWAGLVVLPFIIGFFASGNILLAVILGAAGAVGPIIVIKMKQKKRIDNFNNQLSDALLIVCNCLRSGLTFGQAMENIAEEMDDPIGKEFQRSVNEMNYGASQEVALEGMLERVNSADLSLTVAAVNIQRQTGGNLSEILETISDTIRDRLKIRKEIKALTGQGRASGMIIGLLPVVLALVLMVMNPDYMTPLIEKDIGHILILVCFVMEGMGFFFINKIVDIKI